MPEEVKLVGVAQNMTPTPPPPYFNLNPYISVDGPVESMKLE